ncbi:F-box/LRR-repeat protein 13 [Bienertia sinuspersici]
MFFALNYEEVCKHKQLQGNNDEVQLAGYILKNATVLNELLIEVFVDIVVEDEDARVEKELKFYKACFRLPTSSSMTRVVFSGQYLTTTNDTITSRNQRHDALKLEKC